PLIESDVTGEELALGFTQRPRLGTRMPGQIVIELLEISPPGLRVATLAEHFGHRRYGILRGPSRWSSRAPLRRPAATTQERERQGCEEQENEALNPSAVRSAICNLHFSISNWQFPGRSTSACRRRRQHSTRAGKSSRAIML